jgi:hypothetical protein
MKRAATSEEAESGARDKRKAQEPVKRTYHSPLLSCWEGGTANIFESCGLG